MFDIHLCIGIVSTCSGAGNRVGEKAKSNADEDAESPLHPPPPTLNKKLAEKLAEKKSRI
jgi:hypothetical protein